MKTVKKELIEMAKNLDDSATWEDVIYEAYVKEKLNKAIENVEKGNVISHEDVMDEMRMIIRNA